MALAVADGRGRALVVAADAADALGINDRVALAAAEERMRRRINETHMRNGVTIVEPATTRIDAGVEIGQDARIEPGTTLQGATVIAQDAVIGPNAHVRDSRIGPRSHVWASVVEEASVAEDVQIGPFAHLRPGAEIGPRCRIGNFAEVKNSRLGAGTQQHHFSYLGDAEVGENVNVGAGSVTANFDGTRKHRTVVGERRQPRGGHDDGRAGHHRRGRDHRGGGGRHPRRRAGQDGGRRAGPPDRDDATLETAGRAGNPGAGEAPVPSGADRNP